MRVVERFWRRNPAAEKSLRRWSQAVESELWLDPHHAVSLHSNARFLDGNRLIFNIRGNRYRLVVEVNYELQSIDVRFIGSHTDYDRIGARRI